jgi:hypothetical protein
VAVGGYEAVRVWRKVHVERPRASTSGGQSGGWEGRAVAVVEGGVVLVLGVEVEGSFFVMAAQEAKEVQERQLLFLVTVLHNH